jgi:diguanylate cyclase
MAQQKRILVADDDQSALMLMGAALRGAGYLVTVAADGEDALRQFRKERPDLVMLDVDMPERSGFEVCEIMRHEVGELLPIVIVTGMDDVESVDKAYRVGATDFILKPISWALISHRVRYLLRGSQINLDLQAAQENIRKLAYFDTLTGLPNREHFRLRLAAALGQARQDKRSLALLCIDLDNFKRINDTLGHGVGDELLCLVASRLREVLRTGDAVGRAAPMLADPDDVSRQGGDEFMVMLPLLAGPEDAGAVAERIAAAISRPMLLSQHEVMVSPSIGIAVCPADGEDHETLVRNADLAMYFAKRRAPGTFAFFDPTMSADALKRMTIEGELRWAIERNQFSLEYQPQFDLSSGRISCMEALLRWQNPELGSVPPADFIPVAEQTGLILPIGEWVLRAACAQALAWQVEGIAHARMAVNVSGLQLAQPGFCKLVETVLTETGLQPDLLELEIAESVIMQDDLRAVQTIRDLKAMGVQIAIDDFGTGHSSFARLSEFPVDRLKIDRAFVKRAHLNTADQAIAAAIIAMARTLQLEVVAEGVEEIEQLLLLQDEKCALGQGYLLSRPLRPADALQLLRRSSESRETSRTERLKALFS